MFCPNCGKEFYENSNYCLNCGAKITVSSNITSNNDDNKFVNQNQNNNPNNAQQTTTEANSQVNNENILNTENCTQRNNTDNNITEKKFAEGCFKAAWRDIVETPKWFGKIILLGLINCVPILSFVSQGYALKWSKDVACGNRETMPNVKITSPYFTIGFYVFVFSLLIGVASSIVAGILNVIPFVGFLAFIVLLLFSFPFFYLCYLRMVMKESLSGVFEFQKIWKAFTFKMDKLFACTLVPTLIFSLVSIIIIMVLAAIFILVIFSSNPNAMLILQNIANVPSLQAAFLYTYAFSIFIFSVIGIIILSCFGTFLNCVVFRATGHWIARYQPQWSNEAVKSPKQ